MVFDTEPLRKVADKQEFEGAVACFSGGEKAYQKRLLSEAGSGTLLITADPSIELAADGKGIPVMRTGTFSKALEGGQAKGRTDRGRSERGGQNRMRNRSRNRSRIGSGEAPKKPREPESSGGVESLIDIVE